GRIRAGPAALGRRAYRLYEGTYAINLAQFIVLTAQSNYAVNLNSSEQKLFSEMSEMIAERDGFEPVVIRENAVEEVAAVSKHLQLPAAITA
ncbi:hypothetical protein ACC720_37920, partial [Rhizobium ruizarguesonis]